MDKTPEQQAAGAVAEEHAEQHKETRQERRARKLAARRERMPKHGAGLLRTYADAILKRAGVRRRP